MTWVKDPRESSRAAAPTVSHAQPGTLQLTCHGRHNRMDQTQRASKPTRGTPLPANGIRSRSRKAYHYAMILPGTDALLTDRLCRKRIGERYYLI